MEGDGVADESGIPFSYSLRPVLYHCKTCALPGTSVKCRLCASSGSFSQRNPSESNQDEILRQGPQAANSQPMITVREINQKPKSDIDGISSKHPVAAQEKIDCTLSSANVSETTKIFNESPWECRRCPRVFETGSLAFQHNLYYKHNFPCPELNCDRSYDRFEDLKEHLELHKELSSARAKPGQNDPPTYGHSYRYDTELSGMDNQNHNQSTRDHPRKVRGRSDTISRSTGYPNEAGNPALSGSNTMMLDRMTISPIGSVFGEEEYNRSHFAIPDDFVAWLFPTEQVDNLASREQMKQEDGTDYPISQNQHLEQFAPNDATDLPTSRTRYKLSLSPSPEIMLEQPKPTINSPEESLGNEISYHEDHFSDRRLREVADRSDWWAEKGPKAKRPRSKSDHGDGSNGEEYLLYPQVPYVFRWEHPATEVFVTGNFDEWRKTILLNKTGELFTREVLLPPSMDEVYYKFVVDGNWMVNPTVGTKSDHYGNENNVITHEELGAIAWFGTLSAKEKTELVQPDNNVEVANPALSRQADAGSIPNEIKSRLNDSNTQDPGESSHAMDEPGWDLRSIDSIDTYRDSALGSSLPSEISISVLQGLPRTAQEEILVAIISDAALRSLFEEATRKIDKYRFIRNIRRLFLLFHKDLVSSGSDPREFDALRIIQKHTHWLASRLFDVCSPKNSSNADVLANYLHQHLDKRPMLERYLASMVSPLRLGRNATMGDDDLLHTALSTDHTQPNQLSNIEPEEDGQSPSEMSIEESQNGEAYIDYSNFPNLERIKNFIVGGTAFEKLRQNTLQWIHPMQQADPAKKSTAMQTPALTTAEKFHDASGSPDALSQKSSTLSGSTDVTVPDIDVESDDGDSDLSSDPDLVDRTSEDRILNPNVYFNKLRSLEQDIFDNSGLAAYNQGTSAGDIDDDQYIRGSRSNTARLEAFIDVDSVISVIKFSSSEKLLQLLECYDLMVRICSSVKRLQDAGYCTSYISILVQDKDRAGVAKLLQIEVSSILHLGASIESLMRGVIDEVSALHIFDANQTTVNEIVERQDHRIGVTSECLKILSSMGFTPHLLLNDTNQVIWDCAFQCLDLAIVSYAGAHIHRFDLDHLGNNISSLSIPRRFIYHDQTLRGLSSLPVPSIITLRRRQFQCLDKFLGAAQPWVFHQDFCNVGNQRLYLSTSIGALTDVWGPSWKIIRDSEPGRIQQLDIGNGAILPWPVPGQQGKDKVEIHSSEVFCHWMPLKDWKIARVEENQACISKANFSESDILLVGATPELGLVQNKNCMPSTEQLLSIKTKLEQQGALRDPKTFRARRFLDSHAVQVQGSAMGFVSASGTVTYKRQKGQTMKDALVERWRHNLRNPMDLEAFSGVEISLCTRNARRRRLLHLLGSPTMHNYLRGISFVWLTEACEYAYLKALRSPKHFRKFWKNLTPENLENVGDAVSRCLDALEETGIDHESRELRGLWVESFDNEGDSDGESDNESDDGDKSTPPPYTDVAPTGSDFYEEWVVTLFRSEYTWTGFLEDSEESLTMAILGTTCLDFDHDGYGRRCSQPSSVPALQARCKGYPALQTSLQVNTELLTNIKLKSELVSNGQTTIWNAKELKKGSTFCLGDHGSLKVLTAASRTCPTIMEWNGVKSEVMKEVKNVAVNEKLLGRPKEKHHREHIRGKWAEKPLPVLVLSKSNKVVLSKE